MEKKPQFKTRSEKEEWCQAQIGKVYRKVGSTRHTLLKDYDAEKDVFYTFENFYRWHKFYHISFDDLTAHYRYTGIRIDADMLEDEVRTAYLAGLEGAMGRLESADDVITCNDGYEIAAVAMHEGYDAAANESKIEFVMYENMGKVASIAECIASINNFGYTMNTSFAYGGIIIFKAGDEGDLMRRIENQREWCHKTPMRLRSGVTS